MTISRKQIGLIKTLQAKAGLDDEDYRAMLHAGTGKDSATRLTGAEAHDVIARLQALVGGTGYRPRSGKAYVRRIYVVWRLLAEAGVVNRKGLKGFVKSRVGTDSPEWLDPAQGRDINEALKAMARREGVSLDR